MKVGHSSLCLGNLGFLGSLSKLDIFIGPLLSNREILSRLITWHNGQGHLLEGLLENNDRSCL